jgi:hypothetical protein
MCPCGRLPAICTNGKCTACCFSTCLTHSNATKTT